MSTRGKGPDFEIADTGQGGNCIADIRVTEGTFKLQGLQKLRVPKKIQYGITGCGRYRGIKDLVDRIEFQGAEMTEAGRGLVEHEVAQGHEHV